MFHSFLKSPKLEFFPAARQCALQFTGEFASLPLRQEPSDFHSYSTCLQADQRTVVRGEIDVGSAWIEPKLPGPFRLHEFHQEAIVLKSDVLAVADMASELHEGHCDRSHFKDCKAENVPGPVHGEKQRDEHWCQT